MYRRDTFFRPFDAAIAILVAATSAWGFLAFRVTEGSRATVYMSNKRFAWYELGGDKRKVEIDTRIGPIALEIGQGAARVLSSPCPNKICVKTGAVRHVHGEIVCLPAHLLLVIEGDSRAGRPGGEIDAVTF
jgi:hypothetical protein